VQIFDLLQRRHDFSNSRQNVPCRCPVHEDASGRLPGHCSYHCHADPLERASWRHSALPHGSRGDRHRWVDSFNIALYKLLPNVHLIFSVFPPSRTPQRPRKARAKAQRVPCICPASRRNAGLYFQSHSSRRAKVRHRHEHRRGIDHNRRYVVCCFETVVAADVMRARLRRHILCRGPWVFQAEGGTSICKNYTIKPV
jgi:hypothetical protein